MTVSTVQASLASAQKATTFVFGGHIGPQSKQSLAKHVRPLMDGPHGKWILDAVADLPRYWGTLVDKIPDVAGTMDGAQLLADLASWLRLGDKSGDSLAEDAEIPDIWIGPLMIAIQLDQYWRFLEFRFGSGVADPQAALQKQAPGDSPFETVGFCAGMIAAVAVASAHNRQEFEAYGAAALRIGTMMAALVGAGEAWDKSAGKGGSVSMATAWRSRKQGDDMARIVAALSPAAPDDAYVSVLFDEARATVTASERLAGKLVRQLRAAGVTAIPLAFKGKLHTPGPQRARHTAALIEACRDDESLRFPDAVGLALPTYIDHPEGRPVDADDTDLVGKVLRSILADQLNWASTVAKLAAKSQEGVSMVAFGLDRPLPPTILRGFGSRQAHFEELEEHMPARQAVQTADETKARQDDEDDENNDDVIAVVGMSLQVAGADDLDEFADMIKTGTSQHQAVSRERMTYEMMYRDDADADPTRTWYGNFLRDADAFDHKFFKRSPREAKCIDPQGRLSMQAAYQAVAQSGYFADTATAATAAAADGDATAAEAWRKHVGVYVGLCSFEYEINIARHQPTAFTATGGLRSFIPGRLSHYFGWTGPSLSLDTACSSSTVALHTACRDLLAGETAAALVGGVNVLTNLEWTQNLAAGSFISPSGQCKPFDAAADGYCRGDGIAYVFLKKLSAARADGTPVLGTIRATGVNQNRNSTPLFVPNVPSLSALFRDVVRRARVAPRDIGLVECHGTGTPVGDPAEYESIRQAVAGPLRDTAVPIGSVKGHVGHTEGASGLVSLIKVLTMMRGGFIPPQASFQRMNPHIPAAPADQMEVVTALRPWTAARKVALVNNYGACGSNGSFVVAHAAAEPARTLAAAVGTAARLPFRISGLDARSVAAYATVLAPYLHRHADEATLADLSFHMARQSNPGLPQSLVVACSSVAELQDKIAQAAVAGSAGVAPTKKQRPVVLCFGGQVATSVGLDRALYDGVAVLRKHLDACDAAITAHGLDSIFPAIFSTAPIADVVQLQTALFALQYAAAKSWLDCGLAGQVVSVVGHSFGEITALCVAGVLSLADTVKLIAGRARLVRDVWGPDAGAMMAVEADEALVHALLAEANSQSDGSAGIACYNGPRSFTLAGSTPGMDAVARVLAAKQTSVYAGVRSKRLSVTNAFHSALVEPLVAGLDGVGKSVTFNDAILPVERATQHGSPGPTDWTFVRSHMRQPVFFHQALQRLVARHPEAVFLEAGSNSTIAVMASRALAQATPPPAPDALHFQSVSITNTSKGIDGLTDATVSLWKQGVRVSFWAHHASQVDDYAQLLLPPYQFEKSRHWLENKSPSEDIRKAAEALVSKSGSGLQPQTEDPEALAMWTFLGFQRKRAGRKLARFRINTASAKYQRLFATHVIALTAPICPATLEMDMAIEALFSLNPDWRAHGFAPVVRDVLTHSPICADSSRAYYIDLAPLVKDETAWSFAIHSVDAASDEKHAEGRIQMCAASDPGLRREFGRYERLVTHAQCQAVLHRAPGDAGVEALHGAKNVYRAFREVVDFGDVYCGVRCVVGSADGVSAGIVHKQHGGDTWLDVPRADSFGQVAGMYVNLLTPDLPASDMCVATGIELVMRAPTARTMTDGAAHGAAVWHVYARHARQADNKSYLTDVFVFDSETGQLAEVILGLKYVRVPKAVMSKILSRMTTDKAFVRQSALSQAADSLSAAMPPKAATGPPSMKPKNSTARAVARKPARPSGGRDLAKEVRDVVASVSGLEAGDMTLESEMADLGIDSLMGMELGREIENTFAVTLDQSEQMAATSLGQFVACVANALSKAGKSLSGDNDNDDDEDGSVEDGSVEDGSVDDDSNVFSDAGQDDDSASSGIPTPQESLPEDDPALKRQIDAERLKAKYSAGWVTPALAAAANAPAITVSSRANAAVVVVTGATGSLGSHLVQALAERPDVAAVVCINRPVRSVPAAQRQAEALASRGITLAPAAQSKLRVYATDTAQPALGLPASDYAWLVQNGTHIVHNAWPMSGTRPLAAYEPQIRVMRNLLDLARDMAVANGAAPPRRVGFEFVSSIGVAGFFGQADVPEALLPLAAAIPSGYNEGKWVCERMLSETLRQYPRLFRASAVRPGQITGSTASGVWNPVEHFPFLVKSAQALRAFPDLGGVLHWLPVDQSASVMVDILQIDSPDAGEAYPVYHVDNPVGQPWQDMARTLAAALDIPAGRIVPFGEWVQLVRQSSLSDAENPAARVIDFLDGHFERMACGGVVLATKRAEEHSKTMAGEGPVSADVVRSYVSAWKAMGFLN